MTAPLRTFDTGATRDLDVSKLDYEGFLSPLVLQRFAEYMHVNRKVADGSFRDSDNWQRGIPKAAYMKSGWRHFFDWWKEHRGIPTKEGIELALCGLLFNAMGYLHEHLKAKVTPTEHHAVAAPMRPAMEALLQRQAEEPDGLNAGKAWEPQEVDGWGGMPMESAP